MQLKGLVTDAFSGKVGVELLCNAEACCACCVRLLSKAQHTGGAPSSLSYVTLDP